MLVIPQVFTIKEERLVSTGYFIAQVFQDQLSQRATQLGLVHYI